MKNGKIFTVPFRRKREGRTYYKSRMKMLMSGKYRFVARKSLKNLQASVVQFDPKGDRIAITVDSKALLKIGWKGDTGNLSSAYLIGYIAGKKAQEKGIKDAEVPTTCLGTTSIYDTMFWLAVVNSPL